MTFSLVLVMLDILNALRLQNKLLEDRLMTNRMEIDKLLEKYQISKLDLLVRQAEDLYGWDRISRPVGFGKWYVDENDFVSWWGVGEDKKTNLERRLKVLIEKEEELIKMLAEVGDDEDFDIIREMVLEQQESILRLGSELEALDEKWKI